MTNTKEMSSHARTHARDLLFNTAVDLMEAGDYDTARIMLRLSALLGNHDSALRNLYDDAWEEERWFLRFVKTTFYRILLSLSNSKRLFWVKNDHRHWQMVWIDALDIRCPYCGALNEHVDLTESDGWLACAACKRSIQAVIDGKIQYVPIIRAREET